MTKLDNHEELRHEVNEHAVEIAKSLNPQELVPILVERGLLSDKERKLLAELTCRQSQREKLLEYFRRSPEPFLQCLEREENHKGHRYIIALVTGVEFGIEAQVQRSQEYEERVKQNRQEIVRDLDMTYLVPVMLKTGLLTWSECEELKKWTTYEGKSTYLLDQVLVTKGPLAYVWLADCLERECRVPRHAELFELITGRKPRSLDSDSEGSSGEESDTDHESTSSTSSTAVPKPKRQATISSPEPPLTGDAYESVMKVLWDSCCRGQWDVLEVEARKLTDNDSTDVQLKVIAWVELARSHVFHQNWMKVDEYIQKVKLLIDEADIMAHSRTNTAYLVSRAELVLFFKYLFIKDLKRAEEHLDLAKEALFNVDISMPCEEDAVWILYCTGCLQLEQLWVNHSDSVESSTEDDFETAIKRACSYRKDTIEQHSYIRLAQLYLGCSHFNVGTARNRDSIEWACHCLDKVQKSADSLPCRSEALYFIALSDLHRNTGALEQAQECAQKAMDLASVGFRTEQSAAQGRLEAVTKINGQSTS